MNGSMSEKLSDDQTIDKATHSTVREALTAFIKSPPYSIQNRDLAVDPYLKYLEDAIQQVLLYFNSEKILPEHNIYWEDCKKWLAHDAVITKAPQRFMYVSGPFKKEILPCLLQTFAKGVKQGTGKEEQQKIQYKSPEIVLSTKAQVHRAGNPVVLGWNDLPKKDSGALRVVSGSENDMQVAMQRKTIDLINEENFFGLLHLFFREQNQKEFKWIGLAQWSNDEKDRLATDTHDILVKEGKAPQGNTRFIRHMNGNLVLKTANKEQSSDKASFSWLWVQTRGKTGITSASKLTFYSLPEDVNREVVILLTLHNKEDGSLILRDRDDPKSVYWTCTEPIKFSGDLKGKPVERNSNIEKKTNDLIPEEQANNDVPSQRKRCYDEFVEEGDTTSGPSRQYRSPLPEGINTGASLSPIREVQINMNSPRNELMVYLQRIFGDAHNLRDDHTNVYVEQCKAQGCTDPFYLCNKMKKLGWGEGAYDNNIQPLTYFHTQLIKDQEDLSIRLKGTHSVNYQIQLKKAQEMAMRNTTSRLKSIAFALGTLHGGSIKEAMSNNADCSGDFNNDDLSLAKSWHDLILHGRTYNFALPCPTFKEHQSWLNSLVDVEFDLMGAYGRIEELKALLSGPILSRGWQISAIQDITIESIGIDKVDQYEVYHLRNIDVPANGIDSRHLYERQHTYQSQRIFYLTPLVRLAFSVHNIHFLLFVQLREVLYAPYMYGLLSEIENEANTREEHIFNNPAKASERSSRLKDLEKKSAFYADAMPELLFRVLLHVRHLRYALEFVIARDEDGIQRMIHYIQSDHKFFVERNFGSHLRSWEPSPSSQ